MLCEKAKKHMNRVGSTNNKMNAIIQELGRMCDCMRSGCCPVCGSGSIRQNWLGGHGRICKDCGLELYTDILEPSVEDRGRIDWCFDAEKDEVKDETAF